MSSVSGSERGNHNDELRRKREEYQDRESEQVKRHKREVRRINQKHDQEIQNTREAYERQIEDLKGKSYQALTEKDQENQDKINQLRAMYTDQMRKKAEANEESKNILRESVRAELEKQDAIHSQQTNRLNTRFDSQYSQLENKYKEKSKEQQDEMVSAIEKRTKSLNEKHQKEVGALATDRDRRIVMEVLKRDQLKTSLEDKVKFEKTLSEREVQRLRANNEAALRNQERSSSEIMTSRDKLFQAEREDMKKDMSQITQKKLEEIQGAHDNLRASVIDRYEKRAIAADNEIIRLKNENIYEGLVEGRLKNLDQKKLINQYEDRIADLENQKSQISEVVNSENRSRVKDILKDNERMIGEIDRRHKAGRGLEKEKQIEERSRLITEKDKAIKFETDRSDKRVDQILKATTEASKEQIQKNNENVGQLKEGYVDRLAKQREAQAEIFRETTLRMDKRLQETEAKFENKMKTTVGNYEGKINQIEKEHRDALKRTEEVLTGRLNTREKAHKMELETQEIKFENKIAMLQEEHDKDIEKIEKRHQEQMANLADRLNYYRKRG